MARAMAAARARRAQPARRRAARCTMRRITHSEGDAACSVPHNGFVVVADGRKMLFLRNEGDADLPEPRVVEHATSRTIPPIATRRPIAPGASPFAAAAAARSSMDEVDFHQLEEDRFAAETADLLKKRALNNDFESLIIVAPPRTLGELRKHYHKEVSSRLIGELDKDLTGHPVDRDREGADALSGRTAVSDRAATARRTSAPSAIPAGAVSHMR